MLTQRQTSAALFTLCLGTFLALLGCSVITSFAVSFFIGIILLGIAYAKRSLISATTVIDADSNCSVTVKRAEQKLVIQEPSFLGKAHVTPIKNTSSGMTPSVQDVKQTLNFTKSANSSLSTPVKVLNNSVIKLKNSHYGGGAWPLNSTPIEKKSVLVEQNYHMMKAINNVQQASPYSVKRSAVEKESPPPVSLHKKPKMQPLLKEGRALRHVPTVYVVHKKAENVLKNKGNKRVLENNENVNDPKRRNKDEDEMNSDKPQKRKLLSIVHITGKKHKVPSINSPTKYSRNTDLVVTNDDLQEDRRRNEERVRKLLAHKDDQDENTKLSIKPAKKPPITESNVNTSNTDTINKPDAIKSLITHDKENTVPLSLSVNPTSATTPAEPNSQLATAETPKSLPKPSDALDTSLVSADSKVVKSLFGNSESDAPKSPKTTLSFGTTSAVKSETVAQSIVSITETKPVLSVGLNTSISASAKTSDSSKVTPAFSFSGISEKTASALPEIDSSSTKQPFSGVGTSSNSSFPLNNSQNIFTSSSVTSTSAPNFLSAMSTTASKNLDTKPFSFNGNSAPATEKIETKPTFSFGPASSSSTSKPGGLSFCSTIASNNTTSTVSAATTSFSFLPSSANPGAVTSIASAPAKSFSSSVLPSTTGTGLMSATSSTVPPSFSFGGNSSKELASSTGFSFGSSTASTGISTASSGNNVFAASTGPTSCSSSTVASSNVAFSTGFSFGAQPATSTFSLPSVASSTSSGFSFGETASAIISAPSNIVTSAPSTGFSFGAAAPSASASAFSATPTQSSGSLFGVSSSLTSTTTSAATFGSNNNNHLFGSPSNVPSAETTSTSNHSAVSSFNFGAANNTTSNTAGFNFGGNSSSPAPTPAPGGFSFGENAPKTESGFNFGASPASSTGFNFGGTAPSTAQPSDSPIPSNLFSNVNNSTPARRIATPRRRKPR